MSTNFPEPDSDADEWVSQAQAARLHGVTRQAINKLVRSGRLRSKNIGGHVIVNRKDLENYNPQTAGRPTDGDSKVYDRIIRLLDACQPSTRERIYQYLHAQKPAHPIERKLGTDAEVILEALDRSGELTLRMFRGIIAEAAFAVHVLGTLPDWESVPVTGTSAFDFQLKDDTGLISIQVKLQRSVQGKAIERQGQFIVETQRTRGGRRRGAEGIDEKTRPYRFGDFDILAVCMFPSSGRWDHFRYSVGEWLQPRNDDPQLIATLQPIAKEANDDWTDDLAQCISWFRAKMSKRIK